MFTHLDRRPGGPDQGERGQLTALRGAWLLVLDHGVGQRAQAGDPAFGDAAGASTTAPGVPVLRMSPRGRHRYRACHPPSA